MATGPKIVHKQFNSPIGLYSQQNIQETLNKHMSNLDNGGVGINFNNPSTDKPANLANSAVLRMLEEEERNRKGELDPSQIQAIMETLVRANHRFDNCWPPNKPGQQRKWNGSQIVNVAKGPKKVVWPPAPETNGYHSPQQQSPAFYNNAQHSPQSQSQPQYHQPQYQEPAYQSQQHYQQPQYQQPQHQQSQYQEPQYQPQPQYYQQPQPQAPPAFSEGKRQEATGISKLIPVGPGVTAAPRPASPYRQGPPSPQPFRQQQNRWAPVPAPLSPQPQNTQPGYPSQYSPQPQFEQYAQKAYEPPATTITLRQQQPVHQKPPPVYTSQPAAASFKGGVNMRGDQKWPPQSVKEAVAAENEARLELARGPACRPRKVKKDYSSFFAKNALNHNYPGYRVPPGTQHYEDNSGRSSY